MRSHRLDLVMEFEVSIVSRVARSSIYFNSSRFPSLMVEIFIFTILTLWTPCNVLASLIIVPSRMSVCNILNTLITCLQINLWPIIGQSHCGHLEVGAWIVHTLGMWLADFMNTMSSPFGCNKTLQFGISQA